MPAPIDDLMLCIFYLQLKPRRKLGDHVPPYAIGGSLVIDRVCGDCDHKHGGRIDASLVRHPEIERRRADLEIAGQSGRIPDPDLTTYKYPLVSKRDPLHRIKVTKNKNGALVGKTLPHVEFDVSPHPHGKLIRPTKVYIDLTDTDKAEKLALTALHHKGITGNDAARVPRRSSRRSKRSSSRNTSFQAASPSNPATMFAQYSHWMLPIERLRVG